LEKHEFYAVLAEELLAYTDSNVESAYNDEICLPVCEYETNSVQTTNLAENGHSANFDWFEKGSKFRPRCAVCKMENNIREKVNLSLFNARNCWLLAFCFSCDLYGHSSVKVESKLHNFPELLGKTCFEIMHSDYCKGLWIRGVKRRSVSTKHHVYTNLLEMYGLPTKKGNK